MIDLKKIKQVERIKIKLKLAKMNDTFLEVFGASAHKYTLKTPLTHVEVQEFEHKYKVSLPQEYKVF